MSDVARLLPVIRCLYEAATDAGKWLAFLKELAGCFEAKGAHMVRVHPTERVLSFSALYGFDDFVLRLYGHGGAGLSTAFARFEQHFTELMPHDPRIRLIERFPSRPLSCRMSIPEAELHASKPYKELLERADAEYSLVVSLPEDDGSLIMAGVFRGKQSTFFREHETGLFSELIPHIKQAVALSEHLARLDLSKSVAFEALDQISMGIIIIEQSGRIVHANGTAMLAIDQDDGICVCNGVLKLQSKEEDARLRTAVWNATAPPADATPPAQAIAVSRPSGSEPFPLLVCRLWGNHLRYGLGRLDRPLAAIFITIPGRPHEAPAELLRRLFGLTLAEARVCERLVAGMTVEAAAQNLGMAVDTARVHLKSVFGKTGVGRQAELVAKIMSTPLWLSRRTTLPLRSEPKGI